MQNNYFGKSANLPPVTCRTPNTVTLFFYTKFKVFALFLKLELFHFNERCKFNPLGELRSILCHKKQVEINGRHSKVNANTFLLR